ncbi:flavin reductase family protein [Pelagibacterium sp.]|uniref:flavin reductase family protein n=1 Tax=Pelagibacterium sp. TaxID=1967288 RepID=UPI003A95AB24
MTRFHSYDPAQGHGLPHDPIKAIVAPRPIGWISSCDTTGSANLAPYSFFNIFCSAPPILIFGSEGRKDSINNIEATGEFVYNLATRDQAEVMNVSSGAFDPWIDEFAEAGIAKLPSDEVSVPRVCGAPASFECKLLEIKPLVDLNGNDLSRELVIGQVVRVHIDESYLRDGLFDIERARPIARCGYRGDYAEVSSVFEMLRPAISS